MSVAEILEEIRALSPEERKELMKLMVDTLTENPETQKNTALWNWRGLARKFGRETMHRNLSISFALNGIIVREA